jgi:DNA-binding NarL/FixJ family response regulator
MTSGDPIPAKEPGPARVVLADDHMLIRQGLKSMLDRHPDVEIVGEAENGLEALELCRSSRPDLVLMDVRMPKMNGLEASQAIKQEFPQTSVLIVTSHEDPDYLFEAIKAGCAGYVLKEAGQEELTTAIRKVLDGEALLDPDLSARLLRRMVDETQKQNEEPAETSLNEPGEAPISNSLSPREVEVLRLVAKGQTNRQITQNLLISLGTVKIYVRRIIEKLRVSDRTQAAVRAVELGLLPPEPK